MQSARRMPAPPGRLRATKPCQRTLRRGRPRGTLGRGRDGDRGQGTGQGAGGARGRRGPALEPGPAAPAALAGDRGGGGPGYSISRH